ncbi:MAG: hypothetical protein KF785_11340 [Gemmatimonadales bacterium]|nr:hypothetical protein [Gemmatimonadales bacterium]
MINRATLGTLALGALLTAAPLSAQNGLAVRASTLGLGGELSFRSTPSVSIRIGANALSLSRDLTVDEIDYRAKPALKSATAILDLHPMGGSFRISGGVIWSDNRADIEARLNGPVTIGNRTYTPNEVGSLTGGIEYEKRWAPYLGIGVGGGGKVSLLLDAGVIFSGHPTVALSGTTNLTGPERDIFNENVEREVAEFQAEIDRRSYLKFYPVVSLGLRIRL